MSSVEIFPVEEAFLSLACFCYLNIRGLFRGKKEVYVPPSRISFYYLSPSRLLFSLLDGVLACLISTTPLYISDLSLWSSIYNLQRDFFLYVRRFPSNSLLFLRNYSSSPSTVSDGTQLGKFIHPSFPLHLFTQFAVSCAKSSSLTSFYPLPSTPPRNFGIY